MPKNPFQQQKVRQKPAVTRPNPYETLYGLRENDWWPTLGDAQVLAHGMANGCPVASYEWLHKDDWRRTQINQAFPYLVLQ